MRRVFVSFLPRFWLLFVLILVIALIAGAFLYGRYSVYKAHPDLTSVDQAQQVLADVGKLIKLPEGETPSLATITDAVSVKAGQPFLLGAENGDVLIVYAAAQMALLYRPSSNQLIAVGPVTGEQEAAAPSTAETEPENIDDETSTTTDSE